MKNLSNVKFQTEYNDKIMKELHSLAKFAVLEELTPDYYGKISGKRLSKPYV